MNEKLTKLLLGIILFVSLLNSFFIVMTNNYWVKEMNTQPKSSRIENTQKWKVEVYYKNGFSSVIHCDSLQMISTEEAYIFTKGTKTHIFGYRLQPSYK